MSRRFPNRLIFSREERHQAGQSVYYSHTLHYHLSKTQVTEDSRRAISQCWTTTPANGEKCVKDGHCYCVRVCSMLPAPRHTVYSLLYEQHHIAELWRPILFLCCPLTVCCKFCHKSFYLFDFQR